MGNLSRVLVQSSLAFLVVGSIYTGEIKEFSDKVDMFRKTSPIIGINYEVGTSIRDFKEIFGKAGKENFNDMEVYYIPLKNSEVILIKVSGKNVLVNTGTMEEAEDLKQLLDKYSVNKIDHLILSLPTDENMGGASYIVDKIPTDKIYMPLVSLDNVMVQNFFKVLQYKKQKLTKIETGDIIDLGRAKIHILNVLNKEVEEKTDASIVFVLNMEDKNFLFTGDLKKEKQKQIDWPDVDVLKLGKYGKDEYNSYELVKKSKPEYIIGTKTNINSLDKNVENLVKSIISEEKKDIEMYFSNKNKIIIMKSNGNEISMIEEKEENN